MINIVLISISLAMDCFAVSIAGGATTTKPKVIDALKVGLFFGSFQALMPIIGWYIGFSFKDLIEKVDHWVAFGLLCVIGIKMIYEALRNKSEKRKINLIRLPTLLILSVATSIDALAVGISFSLLDISLYISVAVIGLFAFVFSISGYFIGNKIGKFLESKVELIGGIILIGIGIKILIEHLT
jgi:putative Mn2+ efflux pump MntP